MSGKDRPPGKNAPGLRIATHNVNGLHDEQKVHNLMRLYTEQNVHIICIQETKNNTSRGARQEHVDHWIHLSQQHGAAKCVAIWSNNKLHNVNQQQFSTDQTAHRECGGTAILIRQDILASSGFKLFDDTYSSEDGRITTVHLSWAGHEFTLLNTYWPNQTARQRQFITSLQQVVAQVQQGSLWILGDFNHTADPSKDRMISVQQATGCGDEVQTHNLFMQAIGNKHHLQDIFRYQHPNARGYTRIAHQAPSRIDRQYVSDRFLPFIEQCKVQPCPLAAVDHQPLICHIRPATPVQTVKKQHHGVSLQFTVDHDITTEIETWTEHQWEISRDMNGEILLHWFVQYKKSLKQRIIVANRQLQQRNAEQQIAAQQKYSGVLQAQAELNRSDPNEITAEDTLKRYRVCQQKI